MTLTWEQRRLGDLLELIIDYRGKTPKKLGGDWQESGVPAISAKNIKSGRIVRPDTIKFVSEDLYKKWMKSELEAGDVLLTSEAPLGETLFLKQREKLVLSQRLFALRSNREIIDPRFLCYYLESREGQAELNSRATGATAQGIRQSLLKDVFVNFPKELSAQRCIARTLSAYDDLIEINHKRIKILEEMARALYREWFIEFRFPGYEKTKVVGSLLGKIPEGWAIRPLERLLKDHIGGGWGKETADDQHTEAAWVIRGTDIPDARFCQVADVPHRFHAVSSLQSRRLQADDILFEVSGGSKGQPVGRALLVTSELLAAFNGDNVICASFCKRVRPDVAGFGAELLYLSFVEGYESGEIEQFQVQSTGISNFKWTEYIQQTQRAIPYEPLRTQFREYVAPLFAQIATLGLQMANLRRTRDLLLPRLLSGQIDVSGVSREAQPVI